MGPDQLQRAAFACAVGQCEDTFGTRWGSGDPQLRLLTDLLEATGYTLTKVELDRVTLREDDDPRPALVVALAGGALGEGGRGLADDGEEDAVPRCRLCGCTEELPCEGGCHW